LGNQLQQSMSIMCNNTLPYLLLLQLLLLLLPLLLAGHKQ
jgi:hypothetical protein